ncbi:MAG: chorismate mutase [Rhodothermales bacterium]
MNSLTTITSLLNALAELDEPDPEEGITPWRERIDRIDRIVLGLLNERSKSANAIGHLKQQMGMPIYVPEREQQVLDGVLKENSGPLEDSAVRRLFERIIDETRSLERRKYQHRTEEDDPESDRATP